MDILRRALAEYARDVSALLNSDSTNEETFYPAIRTLLAAVLHVCRLPFDARMSTSERRAGGGADRPDVAFYDGSGDFLVVPGEVKLPDREIEDMATSRDREDQIGRYLAHTHVAILCNVRAFGLLTVSSSFEGDGAIPPGERQLEQVVELWPSASSLRRGDPPLDGAAEQLAELIETAVTQHAPIAEPESLARILARHARCAKQALPVRFSDAVQSLLDDFAQALGTTFEGDEGEAFLRSSLVQTAFYGLFSGWVLWQYGGAAKDFRWEDLTEYLKIPFLGQLFYEFRHPARIKELGLAEHLDLATQTLHRVDRDRFFQRFWLLDSRDVATGAGTASSAIMYFYEPFLEAFDPDLRKELGVWYTPPEIVEYQLRKVDQLLRDELGCNRGLADDRVVVLDPCCGTGAYLIEVVRCVAGRLNDEGAGALLAEKLLDVVCRRVIGFEILTAPFVIAQLQLFVLLSDLGAEPDERHRPAVFLTNALTGWHGHEQLKFNFPELQAEHDAAQRVKTGERIIVVLGNPPYNRWAGVPLDEEAELADHYKGIHRDDRGRQVGPTDLYTRWGVRKHLLDELYVRFFRLAEIRIGEKADFGVVSFISNYSFHTGRSHPIMRESLLRNFDAIWIDNLNGDKYKTGKVIPRGLPGAGAPDQSVFTAAHNSAGIQVGTAITTMIKRRRSFAEDITASVWLRDFWGRSDLKRHSLLEALEMSEWCPSRREQAAALPEGPRDYQQVSPTEDNRWRLAPRGTGGGFEDWPGLDELFPVAFQGVNPNRGLSGSVVDTDRDALEQRMREYFSELPFAELAERHPELCRPRARFAPEAVREQLRRGSGFRDERILAYLLFPFDLRWIYYEPEAKFLNECRRELWQNLDGNEFLIAVPEPRRISESRPLVCSSLFDLHVHDRGAVGFPLHVQPQRQVQQDLFGTAAPDADGPRANLAEPVWQALWSRGDDGADLRSPEAVQLTRDLFHLVLACAHSPEYQEDHRQSLAADFVHVPIPRDQELREEIVCLGRRVALLLDPLQNADPVLAELLGENQARLAVVATTDGRQVRESELTVTFSYYGAAQGGWRDRPARSDEPERPCWGQPGDLFLNDRVYLRNVPERVWRYELGGYPVLKKWLGYRDAKRRNGPLTLDEVAHLRSMVHRLCALISLNEHLDAAYERAAGDALTAEELGCGEGVRYC